MNYTVQTIAALLDDLATLMKDGSSKLEHYARRQGKLRMPTKGGLGGKRGANPHAGEHYPQIQSCIDQLKHKATDARTVARELRALVTKVEQWEKEATGNPDHVRECIVRPDCPNSDY